MNTSIKLNLRFTRKTFIMISLLNLFIYWFIGVVVVFNLYGESIFKVLYNDFYDVIKRVYNQIIIEPSMMYRASEIYFVNLPSLALYFFGFSAIPSNYYLDIIITSFVIFMWNLGTCNLIYKIMKTEQVKKILGNSKLKNPYILMSIYMAVTFHYGEYYSGQFNAITGFFVLLGIYYSLNNKAHLCFLSWSIACIFKLTIVFLILVFVIQKPLKKTFKNIIYILLGQIPTIIIFLLLPNLFFDFLAINFNKAFNRYDFLSTGTLSVYLEREFNLPIFPTTIMMMAFLFPVNFYIIWARKEYTTFLDRLMISFLLVINIIPNFWGIHVIYYLGTFLIWLATKIPRGERTQRIILSFPSFFGALWIFFKYFSFFYLISLIIMDISFLTRNSDNFQVNREEIVL